MTDFAINQSTGDLLITNGSALLVQGVDAVGQRCYIKLRTFQGEYFLNLRAGFPYHDRILIRGANEPDLIQIYQSGIVVILGVESVDKTELDFGDSDDRTLRVAMDITSDEGDISLTAEVPGVS